MSVKIIVINGSAQAGKDTFVQYVKESFPGPVISHSTIKTVKEVAKMFGADEQIQKGDAERRLWSDLKDAWTRYCDGPFQEILSVIKQARMDFYLHDCALVFLHIREPEEISKVKQQFGDDCITVLVTRHDLATPDNHADQNVRDYEYEYHIENTGTLEDLKRSAETFSELIKDQVRAKEQCIMP